MKLTTTLDRFNQGLRQIKEKGGVVSTEYLDSTIEGTVEIQGVSANFEFNQGELTIVITDKPWLATDSMIEDEIRKFFR